MNREVTIQNGNGEMETTGGSYIKGRLKACSIQVIVMS